eukprot:m.20496 g.20496  ORF g.20496 m.20496 type:complete len:211 (-) comp3839_c0_seq2:77-709(-)
MQDAVAPSKISLGVTYSCYGPVDILPVQQVASVHRCTVPATIPVVNDRQDYIFREEDCTNGLPSGDCDGMLSKRAQCGLEQDFEVFTPSEGAAKVNWYMTGACGTPSIQAVYMCYSSAQIAALPYTRFHCKATAPQAGSSVHTYRFTANDCGGILPVGNCYGFLQKFDQCGSEEDVQVLEPGDGGVGASWWTSSACGDAKLEVVYHCWAQ